MKNVYTKDKKRVIDRGEEAMIHATAISFRRKKTAFITRPVQ